MTTTAPVSAADFEFIAGLVRRQAGIVLDPGKEYLVETRLQPLLRRSGVGSIGQLVQLMRQPSGNETQRQVIESLTTNETSFFRDAGFYDALRNIVLPELLKTRAASRRLRMWCAASSSGQEPYSVLLTLREHFPQLAGWTVEFIATDLSREMVTRTTEGRYSQLEVNRGLPAKLLVKHFDRHGLDWQVKEDLRRGVDARQLNLMQPWSLGALDIVFIRNVLIYFDGPGKASILQRVYASMSEGGYLFLGGAETPIDAAAQFIRVPADGSGCYRRKP